MNIDLYESADDATLSEISRHAESLLASQLQTAIAADQRALTFSGLLVAGVAAIIAVAAGTSRPALPLVLMATLLGLAAVCSLWSARPTRWFFVGTAPVNWEADLTDPEKTLRRSKAEMVAHYDSGLYQNAEAIRHAAWAMRSALVLTGAALWVAIIWAWAQALR
ncbi:MULTISPECIES: hypothetical protein [Sphingomonas]|uniref:Uncharacterized protein n=1 Tax=Sphingomonas hankookensis TaxID=563996 RepID=A0ABR5YBQ6_9SPHN|nr:MULTISPECIES: hypothetical protein [Sphingomonas]KZE14078.1 hypothetical protein AVT10_15105 [Sphingomonas hankookensis]PZT95553.1 MAG: hypothetical protein DI625_02110 [Sphingomonas sp.]